MKRVVELAYPILRWCPGALGILLRQKFYRSLLAFCGRGVVFGRFVDLRNPSALHIGDNVVISNRCRVIADKDGEGNCSIRIDENVFIGIGTVINVYSGSIHLKKECNIGSACFLSANGVTKLGPCVLMAAYCTVDGSGSPGDFSVQSRITIEEDVWLGARSVVGSSSNIGRGAIIGAHAKVDGDIPAFAIATGDPARMRRYRKNDNHQPFAENGF